MQIDGLSTSLDIVSGFQVLIDGFDYTGHFGAGIATTHDADASFASASFPVVVPFTVGQGFHVIEYRSGWKQPFATAFRGEIVARGRQYYQQHDTVQGAGVLRRTEAGIDTQMAFYNAEQDDAGVAAVLALIPAGYLPIPIVTDADIIIKILEIYGITPETWNHQIHASELVDRLGAPYLWQPATLAPILWEWGMAGWEIISKLDKATTFRTFDGPSGAVYRRQSLGQVPPGVRHTFTAGTDILDLELHTTYEVYNQVIVTGHDIPSLAVAPGTPTDGTTNPDDPLKEMVMGIAPRGTPVSSPYIPDPPRVRTNRDIQVEYIEYADDANALADILLGYLRTPITEIALTTFGCPDVNVGDAIAITAPAVDLANAAGWVITHELHQNPLRSTMKIRASTATVVRGNAPPIASLIVSLVMENLYIAGVLTPVVMVTVDATSSYDTDGSIVSWAITVDTQTVTVTAPAIPIVTIRYTGVSPVAVSLTVTDNDGATGQLDQNIYYNAQTIPVEPIVAAETVDGVATTDGEATWNSFTGTGITVVAPIALGPLTCWSAGAKLYGSLDKLKTPPTLLFTFPATITALWNNEQMTGRWLAGLDTGDVWLSIDAAQTWGRIGNVTAAPINDLAESPFLPGQMTAAAGNAVYTTFDGSHWAAMITGTGTALRFAAGLYAGVSYLYGGFSDSKLYRWRNDTGAFMLLSNLGNGAIRGLTLARLKHELYIFTASTVTFAWDFSVDASDPVPGPSTGTATNYAIRSGVGDWVYLATDGALGKYFPRDAYFDLRRLTSPQNGARIGYSGKAQPVIIVDRAIYVPTRNTSPGGIWRYTTDTWTRIAPPAGTEGRTWSQIAVNPADARKLLIWGAHPNPDPNASSVDTGCVANVMVDHVDGLSPLFHSTDGGATWTAIALSPPTTHAAPEDLLSVKLRDAFVEWNDAGTGIIVGAKLWGLGLLGGGFPSPGIILWRGTVTASTVAALTDGRFTTMEIGGVMAGLSGDAVISANWGALSGQAGSQVGYVAAGANAVAGYIGGGQGTVDGLPGTTLEVWNRGLASTDGISWTADYHTAMAENVVTPGGPGPYQRRLAVLPDGAYVNTSTGLMHITRSGAAFSMGAVVSDQMMNVYRSRQPGAVALVARFGTGSDDALHGGEVARFLLYDGANWTTLLGPAAADARNVNLDQVELEVV